MICKLPLQRMGVGVVAALSLQFALTPQVKANPAAIPAVAACTASVVCLTGVVVIGGITYAWVQWQGYQPQYFPIDTPDYLPDPEQETESVATGWQPTRNRTDAQLQADCEDIARAYGGTNVRVVTNARKTSFYCTFEVPK